MASLSSSSELLNEEIEIQSLKNSFLNNAAKKSNYGSLRKDTQQTTVFIVNYKHKLKPGETLQGISLKYNVPIESIKRANRLWSYDLAFLKDILIVPIRKDKLEEMNLKIDVADTDLNEVDLDIQNTQITKSSSLNGSIIKHDSNNQQEKIQSQNVDYSSMSNNDHQPYKNYLNKFDNIINESKIKLKSLESNSNLSEYQNGMNNSTTQLNGQWVVKTNLNPNDNEDTLKFNERLNINGKDAKATINQKWSPKGFNNGSGSLDSVPEYLIATPNSRNNENSESSSIYFSNGSTNKTSTRARFAQKNLELLEKEKDELFEL